MANSFSHLMTPAAPAPAPTPMGNPLQGPSGNDRIIAPADPYKQAGEQRAQQDQQFQMQSQAREAERLRLAQQSETRQASKDAEGTESERTAGFLAGRITDAITRLSPIAQKHPEAQSPELGAEIARSFPLIGGDKAANYVSSGPRQSVRAAQLDILDAALTLGTGAAYNKEQLQGYAESYLPQLGDAPETIASKRQALRTLLQRAAAKAGKAAPDIEQAIAAFDAIPDEASGEAPKTDRFLPGATERDGGLYDDKGNYLGLAGTVTDTAPDPTNPPPGGPDSDPRFARDPSSLSGLGALAKQGLSLGLSDEAAGIGGYLSGFMTGEDPAKAYVRERDTEKAFLAKARNEWPVMGTAAEFMGGGSAAKVAEAPATLASIARQGAGIGAVGGFGYGEGANSVPGAVVGAAGGAALGAGLYGAGRGLSSLIPGRPAPNMNVVAAGERQNIPIRQPDARPELRGQYAAAESTQSGGPLVREARTADAAAIEARAGEIGGGKAYTGADNTAVGQTAQRIAERGNENVREAASQLYKRVERSAPDFKMPGAQTTAFIDQKITDLKAMSPTGYKAEIDALESMKSDIAQTGLSVGTLQAQRMTVGGRIGDNAADRTRADATLSAVLKVAGEELHSGLAGVNQGAAAALKRADAKWGQYKDLQREVTGLFLGKRGDATAETAARSLGALVNGKGNYSALRRFMTLATPEEKADFATTFALEWGRTGRGRGEFTPAAFAKNLGDQSDRTLNAIFGPEGRTALRDLQAISNAKTDALSRQSPSGVAVSSMGNGLKRLLWGALGLAGGGPTGAIAGGAAQGIVAKLGEERAARMLLNPGFTKWLRNAPNTNNPKVIDRYFSRLAGTVAANDNQAFVGALRSSIGQSPGTVAATTQQEDEARRVPPQQ